MFHGVSKRARCRFSLHTMPRRESLGRCRATRPVRYQIVAALATAGIFDDLQKAFSAFTGSFSTFSANPGAMVKHAIGDLLQIFGDIAVLFLRATNLVLDLIASLVADVLDTLVNFLSGGVSIPVISDLFPLFFGKDLTFLDLVAFVVAVPTSVILKISGASSAGALLSGENAWQLIAWGVVTASVE
jgi:hypothetical protein